MTGRIATRRESKREVGWIGVVIGSIAVSALTVKPYAGTWNDSSRLATVESLVDHGTLVVDDSIFIRPNCQPSPFAARR